MESRKNGNTLPRSGKNSRRSRSSAPEIDADFRKDLFTDLSKAETQANEHAHDISKAAQKRALRMLKAPVDGTVQQLASIRSAAS